MAQYYANPHSQGGRKIVRSNQILEKAKQAFKIGDYNACIELCKMAKGLNAGNKHIVHLMALAYAEAGDNYNANLMFLSAITLDYNFIEARNNYGRFLRKTGKRKAAKQQYETCIKVNPNYPDAHYSIGVLYQDEGDLENAVEEFRTAIRLRPNYFAAKRELGVALYKMYDVGKIKNIKGSVEQLQEAARLIPKNPMIHYYLAKVWCAEGNLDEAEKELRLSLRNDANLAASHYELAKLRYLRGDPDRCIDELKRAFQVNPRYTEAREYPGIDTKKMRILSAKCKEAKGLYAEAAADWKDVAMQSRRQEKIKKKIKELFRQAKKQARDRRKKKALAFDPMEYQALIDRGIREVDEGNMPGGKRTFLRATEINPSGFEGFQNLGGIYEIEGDFQRALGYYKKAEVLVPKFAGIYYNMGFVLEKMRLPIEAGRMYQQYHDIDGKFPYDPKHIINLRLMDERQKQREEFNKKYQSGF